MPSSVPSVGNGPAERPGAATEFRGAPARPPNPTIDDKARTVLRRSTSSKRREPTSGLSNETSRKNLRRSDPRGHPRDSSPLHGALSYNPAGMKRFRAVVIGGSGYGGAELIRRLLIPPEGQRVRV